MSWKRRAREATRGYHHGNLKEALIEAARALIAEKGPAGFTFADAARFAGVSPAAPYRHFRDRDALLADVAREGFQRFEAMLTTGWANGKPDPVTAFHNVGRAYLAFAHAEPAYTGSRYLNKRNTAPAGGYSALSAGIGYGVRRGSLRIDGWNLTNRRPPIAESEMGDAQYYRLPARSVELSYATTF